MPIRLDDKNNPNNRYKHKIQGLLWSDEEVNELDEIVKKIPEWDKLSMLSVDYLVDTINNSPKNKIIFNDPPGSGKSTIIRQYMVDKLSKSLEWNGLYASARIDDAFTLFKHLVALTRRDSSVRLGIFTSSISNIYEYNDLMLSRVLVCTHERLFIEPPSIIYKIMQNPKYSGLLDISSKSYRSDIFIDEIPTNLYRLFDNPSQLNNLSIADNIATSKSVTNSDQENKKLRFDLVDQAIQYHKDKSIKSLNGMSSKRASDAICSALEPISPKFLDRLSYNPDCLSSDLSYSRLTYFFNVLSEKLRDNPSADHLLYSINDFQFDKLIIFSGTGDILAKNSKDYCIVPSKIKRSVKLDDFYMIESHSTRDSSIEDITKDYSSIINKIAEANPDDNILVYTYKDNHNSNGNIPDKLIDKVPKSVKFITYQSGQEQTTSEFSDCSIFVVLGKFFIPPESVRYRNEVLGAKSTIYDYTTHLIIQAIYRTQARLGKSIKLYIDQNYGINFISNLLKLIDNNIDNFNNDNYIKSELITDYKGISDDKLFKFITHISDYCELTNDNNYSINSVELYKLLIGNSKIDNSKISRKLDKYNIKYEYIKGNNNTPSKFIFLKNQLIIFDNF